MSRMIARNPIVIKSGAELYWRQNTLRIQIQTRDGRVRSSKH